MSGVNLHESYVVTVLHSLKSVRKVSQKSNKVKRTSSWAGRSAVGKCLEGCADDEWTSCVVCVINGRRTVSLETMDTGSFLYFSELGLFGQLPTPCSAPV